MVKSLEALFYSKEFTTIPDRVFNVADYGAVGNGNAIETIAIQSAIDAASEAGGGKVVFPKGTYLTGALFVKSNIELHIGEGVILKAIQDNKYYPERWTRVAGIEMDWPSAIINVYEQQNVRITGKGIIDGNGKFWWDSFWGDPKFSGGMWVEYKKKNIRWAVDYDCKRVRPVVIYKSQNVLLKDFTVQRAGFWTVSLTYSDRVHVDGLIIRNNIGGHGPSSDGINTDSSRDILVENCDIDCNDDNLGIKAGKDADGLRVNRPSENIVYRNCITRAGHGLVTLGSETSGGMHNIEVYGLEAHGTNTGIRFKSAKVRGGVMENIWFHDIKMNKVNSPFHFELNWYPEYSYPTIPSTIPENEIPDRWRAITKPVVPVEIGIPEFKDITFSNISVAGASEAFYVNAYEEKPIKNLKWSNVSIEAEESGVINHASDWVFEDVTLTSNSGNPIELTGCTNIGQPELIFPEKQVAKEMQQVLSIQEQIDRAIENDNHIALLPINLSNSKLIADGDTTEFSDSIKVIVRKSGNASMTYFEPLGDGFYYSPVEITISGMDIKVKGQKAHAYTLFIVSPIRPDSVVGADSWHYDKESGQIIAIKKGISFELKIK